MDPFDRAGKRGNDIYKNFAVGKGLALRFELALLVTFLGLVAHTVMSHFRFYFKQLPFLGLNSTKQMQKRVTGLILPETIDKGKSSCKLSKFHFMNG